MSKPQAWIKSFCETTIEGIRDIVVTDNIVFLQRKNLDHIPDAAPGSVGKHRSHYFYPPTTSETPYELCEIIEFLSFTERKRGYCCNNS
uniref:Putative ovule protein n=1 Tax=Solanum chacoense TaxID=4108 RepID=A0A0V0GUT2_SOLCH